MDKILKWASLLARMLSMYNRVDHDKLKFQFARNYNLFCYDVWYVG